MEFCIEDDLYNKIQDYCFNKTIDITEYINDCIVKQFNIDKYGDLNVIINNKTKESVKEEFKVKEITFDNDNKSCVIKHNLGSNILIPLSQITNVIDTTQQVKIEHNKASKETTTLLETYNNIESKKEDVNTVKKKKRTLKTK